MNAKGLSNKNCDANAASTVIGHKRKSAPLHTPLFFTTQIKYHQNTFKP